MNDSPDVHVLAAPLFDPGSGRIGLTVPEGRTVLQMVRAALPKVPMEDLRQCRVSLVSSAGSSAVGHALWGAVRPKAGVLVVIRGTPGKNALKTVLSIAIAVAAFAIGQYWGAALFPMGSAGATIATAAITMGVPVFGRLLVDPFR